MTQKLFSFIILFSSFLGFSQEKVIEGKVIINSSLQGIKVENINRQISVLTDENGTFKIIGTTGEVLVFSALHIERKILFLKEEHLANSIEIKLKSTAIEIEEVEIGKQHNIDFGGKRYTQAERKYKTSGQILKMNQGFEFNLEALGNLFNGKRKQLKKAIEIEETNKLLSELDFYFNEDFYVNSLGLTPEYINDFKYFLVDDLKFRTVLKMRNENDIILEAIKFYEMYQQTKTDEN